MQLFFAVAVMVYAPPSGGAAPKLTEIRAALSQALGNAVEPHALAMALNERDEGWGPADELGFFAAARDKAEEGRRLLERVELDAADAAFADAERIYEAHLQWPGVAAAWSQAALWRGVESFERGDKEAARKLFQRAVALDHATKLTEASARPDVVRAFLDANRPRAKVALTVRGDGVTVDGQPPPAEIQLGEHVVVARQRGRLPQAVLLDVESPLELDLPTAPDPVIAQLQSLRRAPNVEGAKRLASLRGLDGLYAVAAAVDGGELTLVGERIDASGCATPPVTVRGQSAAPSLIERLRATTTHCPSSPEAILSAAPIAHPRPAPVVAVKVRPQPPKKKRFWEKPWMWIGLLAVTTAGIAVGAALAPSTPSYKATIDGSAFTRSAIH